MSSEIQHGHIHMMFWRQLHCYRFLRRTCSRPGWGHTVFCRKGQSWALTMALDYTESSASFITNSLSEKVPPTHSLAWFISTSLLGGNLMWTLFFFFSIYESNKISLFLRKIKQSIKVHGLQQHSEKAGHGVEDGRSGFFFRYTVKLPFPECQLQDVVSVDNMPIEFSL